ncbi:MAG: transcription termination factor NusA [Bacillota bacterium]
MRSKQFYEALDAVVKERGLSKEDVLELLRRGFLNAYKKEYDNNENARVEFKEDKNEILVKADYLVVESDPASDQISLEEARKEKKTIKVGDTLTRDITPKDFGRIAVVSAKQILTQGLKNLEREKVYNIFKERENEMINTEIVGLNKDFVTLSLGHDLETSLPRKELLRTDETRIGAKLKVYITKVEMTTKGPKVFVSRTDRNLVKRLLEQVTPEIMDGTVEIMGLARDAGSRSKVAVFSHDENVDPVGAVVGYKGERIREVLDALQGERIDVYEWSKDPVELIANALEPAKVIAINPDHKEKSAVVIVEDRYYTSAIGAKGQNARLAAQSSGWKIDIKSITDAKEMGIHYRLIDEVSADETEYDDDTDYEAYDEAPDEEDYDRYEESVSDEESDYDEVDDNEKA